MSAFVAAIPPREFTARFMDTGRDLPPAPASDFAPVACSTTDAEAREAFIRVIEGSNACPGVRFYIPKLKKRQRAAFCDEDESRNDNLVAPHTSVAACPLKGERSRAPRKNLSQYYDFATSLLGVEVLADRESDPFLDPEESSGSTNIMRNTIGANAARGRILRSTQALFARQHRTFLFSLVLAGTRARFLLLDRSGVLISESFDYVHSPDVLAGFLWRFAHMDAAARGLDASAVLATRHEAALFADAVHAFLDPAEPSHAARALPDAELSLDHTDTYPIWKITVPGAAGPTELVAQRPFAGRPALVGRCMRGYLAYDLHARRLVFLKDTWRWDEPRLRPECDVYRQLEEAGVPSVPRVEYGGDVGGADGSGTRVGGLCEEKPEWLSVGRGLKGFVHHRVVQDVTYSLDTVRDERELIQALHDTIIALDKTYDDLGILHRDLSVENIRLDAHSRCVLSDWDCAGPPARSGEPFGTSQFMSTRLHYDPPCQNTLTDDLQSVFWVLAVVATSRFARTRAGLPHALLAPEPGTCGLAALVNAKAEVLRRGGKLWEARFGCKALEELLGGLTEAWGEYSRAGEGDMCDARSGEIRDQVARPDFWRKKFAAALRVLDEEEAARDGLSAAVPTSCAGSKRKAVEDLDECVCRGARRSKRLRAMRDGARCL